MNTLVTTFVTIICLQFALMHVEALKCHQCRSHLDSDCLHLTTGSSKEMNNKFFKECAPRNNTQFTFCRKTYMKIAQPKELRVIRDCGWLPENQQYAKEGKNFCLKLDRDWLDETICNCFTDGCNSAPTNMVGVFNFISLLAVTTLLIKYLY